MTVNDVHVEESALQLELIKRSKLYGLLALFFGKGS